MLPESPLHGAIRGSHNCSCYPGQIWENKGEHTEIPNLSCTVSLNPAVVTLVGLISDGCLCILRYTSGLDQWGVECLLRVGLLRLCCTWLVSATSRQRCDSKVQASLSVLFVFQNCEFPFSPSVLQIIGSRNPLNVIKALFIALNAVCAHFFFKIYPFQSPHSWYVFIYRSSCLIFQSTCFQIETPKDVQQKFGRTVVESYLL